MSDDQFNSLARSILKIGGGIGFAAGVAIAVETGALFVALFTMVGTAAMMAGLGMSYVAHAPHIGKPELTLRTLAPESVPADVRAKMKEAAASPAAS